MYCLNCGNKIGEESKFCNECGTKIDSKDNFKSSKQNRDKCSYCGEQLDNGVLKCPSCGNKVKKPEIKYYENLVEKPSFETSNISSEKVTYPNEKIEKTRKINLHQNEKIILKEDGFIYNESEEFEHVLILTNQAVIVLVDEESSKTGDVIRIPFSQINQCIYHRGGFFGEKYIELVTTNGIDRIDLGHGSGKRLALWEMAINDRYKKDTYDRGYDYYKNINIKTLK